MSTTLRDRFPEDKLHILVVKRNAGSFTYDGADTGGERVAEEIEQKLEELLESGHEITKLSVVGYSFGGLIARYAIGLLFHRGIFKKIQPVVCAMPLLQYCMHANASRTSPPSRLHILAYEHPLKDTIATYGTS
jgi:alpha/beta superfamily hydrolase